MCTCAWLDAAVQCSGHGGAGQRDRPLSMHVHTLPRSRVRPLQIPHLAPSCVAQITRSRSLRARNNSTESSSTARVAPAVACVPGGPCKALQVEGRHIPHAEADIVAGITRGRRRRRRAVTVARDCKPAASAALSCCAAAGSLPRHCTPCSKSWRSPAAAACRWGRRCHPEPGTARTASCPLFWPLWLLTGRQTWRTTGALAVECFGGAAGSSVQDQRSSGGTAAQPGLGLHSLACIHPLPRAPPFSNPHEQGRLCHRERHVPGPRRSPGPAHRAPAADRGAARPKRRLPRWPDPAAAAGAVRVSWACMP